MLVCVYTVCNVLIICLLLRKIQYLALQQITSVLCSIWQEPTVIQYNHKLMSALQMPSCAVSAHYR
ncbi:hypothetical protein T01_12499 [Trichinella spiralis]|uniref:Uncharacterized protein n=1 Tax=Trichinella spiralis TaxID=6334 RepID=A0A0V1C166_TRISP|nr:hypothetical protein T01_12499 [Trichinella spiralis]